MSESSPLRGRDGESALIGQSLSAAVRGEGSIVVIEGRQSSLLPVSPEAPSANSRKVAREASVLVTA